MRANTILKLLHLIHAEAIPLPAVFQSIMLVQALVLYKKRFPDCK